jgi:hypothetical protein
MLYDPHRDFYSLIQVAPDASDDDIAAAIERRRRAGSGPELAQAAEVLLDVARRARYDASRALHRIGQLLDFDRARTAAEPVDGRGRAR